MSNEGMGIAGLLMGYRAGLAAGGSIEGETGLAHLKEISAYIDKLEVENEELRAKGGDK